ncbi:extracellular solute-binding protein [Paenibacillus vietnamensis]|uniref:extracellular solute-binding protein n=1 Tax=Paenibacillus vietnamensis TaxID=2590547 RepID=UPI001CD15D84|nr:extracellular solute-binding protein [Paenibacillus vietnamensis]
MMRLGKWQVLACTIAVLLAAGAGCSSDIGRPEAVTLHIVLPGSRPERMDAVIAEAERRMKNSLNVKLDIEFVAWPDLAQKTELLLTTGAEVDLIFDAPWLHLNRMAGAGYYEPLERLLQQYGSELVRTRPETMWEANKIDGRIMAIPLGAYQSGTPSSNHSYLVRRDLREKLGIPPISSYEELVAFEYAVKESFPGMVPFSSNTAGDSGEASIRLRFDYDTHIRSTHALGQSAVLYYKNNDGKVYNLFDRMEPLFWEYVLHARKLYLDGIIDPDIMATRSDYDLLTKGGQAVSTSNDFGVPSQLQRQLEANVPGAKLEAVTFYRFTPGSNVSNFVQGNFIAVPASSRKKEKAVAFLNWANRKDNYDLLAYGIEGEDWEDAGEGLYMPIGTGYSWFPYAWIWNPAHDRLNVSQDADSIRANRFIKDGGHFKRDRLTGFSFDSSPVASELLQYQRLENRYYSVLVNGAAEPEQLWAAFKSEAGLYAKRIQTELQRQIDEFLSGRAAEPPNDNNGSGYDE